MIPIDTSLNNKIVNFTPIPQTTTSAPSSQSPSDTKFLNNENFKDGLLIKLESSNSIDSKFFIDEKLTSSPLPSLKKGQLDRLCEVFKKPRVIKDKQNKFHIEFTLLELFNFIHSKKIKNIVAIELVGSGVAWVLGDYILDVLQKIGLKDLKAEESQKWIAEYSCYPSDFDFRFILSSHSSEDLQDYNNLILEFMLKKASAKSKTQKNELKKHIINRGFKKLSDPILNDGNYCITVGLKDESGDCFDLIFVKKLKRKNLFIQDDIIIIITELILKFQCDVELPLNIIPTGECRNGYQAILDRLTSVVRAIAPETIDFSGWALLLTSYVKGRRSFEPDLENVLFKSMQTLLNNPQTDYLLPSALQKELKKNDRNQQPIPRIVVGIVFLLKKCISNHLKANSIAAFMLTFQACHGLYKQGLCKEVELLWEQMRGVINSNKEDSLAYRLHNAIGTTHQDFFSVTTWLEITAFLSFAMENQSHLVHINGMSFHLIHHHGQPTIQIEVDGFYLLLPFQPLQAIKNWASLEINLSSKSPIGLLSAHVSSYSPYMGKEHSFLGRHTEACKMHLKEVESLYESVSTAENLRPCQIKCVEWLLAYGANFVDPYADALLEALFPKFITHFLNPQDAIRIVISYINKARTNIERSLYDKMQEAIKYKNFSVPLFLLKWCIALCETQTPSRILKAHELWKQNYSKVIPHEKVEIGSKLVAQMSITRPDLALSVWGDLLEGDPLLKAFDLAFSDLLKNIKKQPSTLDNSLLQIVKYLEKVSLSELKKKQHAQRLYEIIDNIHIFITTLLENNKSAEAAKIASRLCFLLGDSHKEVNNNSLIYIGWSNYFTSFFKHAQIKIAASLWIKLFRKFHFSQNPLKIDCLEFLSLLQSSSAQAHPHLLLHILEASSLQAPENLLERHTILSNSISFNLLNTSPEEASQILLGLVDKAPKTHGLFREYVLNLYNHLMLLSPLVSPEKQRLIVKGLSQFLSSQTQSLGSDEKFNKILSDHQHIIFNPNSQIDNEANLNILLKEIARHNLCLQLSQNSTDVLSQFFHSRLTLINKGSSFDCMDGFNWMLKYCSKTPYPQSLQAFYFELISALSQQGHLEQEKLCLQAYLDFVEQTRIPCDELNYIKLSMDWHQLFLKADPLLSQKIIDHMLVMAKKYQEFIVKELFTLMNSNLNITPLRSITLLDKHSLLFHRYIDPIPMQEYMTYILQKILKDKNYDDLKLMFAILNNGYAFSFDQWKLILHESSSFDQDLFIVISHFLFPNFENHLLSCNDQKERSAFCMSIVNNAGKRYPAFLINMLANIKVIINCINDPSMEFERLDILEKLFINSAELSSRYGRGFLPKLLFVWLNAMKLAEEALKIPPQDGNSIGLESLKERRTHLLAKFEQIKILFTSVAGDEEQFKQIILDLPSILSRMSAKPNELLAVLKKLYTHLPTHRRTKIMQHSLSWIDQNMTPDGPLLDFFCKLTEYPMEPSDFLSLLETIHETKCYVETGCILAFVYIAQNQTLLKEQEKKIIFAFLKSLQKIDRLQNGISPILSIYLLQTPYINISEHNEVTHLFNLMFKLHDTCRTVASSKRMIDVSKRYSSIIFKRPEIYKTSIPFLVHALGEVYLKDPIIFLDYFEAYIKYVTKQLCILYKSEKTRKSILSLLSRQMAAHLISCMDLQSETLEHSLLILSYIFGLLFENEMAEPETADSLVHNYVYLPIPDKFSELQKHHFQENVTDLLKAILINNPQIFTPVRKYEYFLLTDLKEYSNDKLPPAMKHKSFMDYIHNLLSMHSQFGAEYALCVFLKDSQGILKAMKTQNPNAYYDFWKEFVSTLSLSSYFPMLSKNLIACLSFSYLKIVSEYAALNKEDKTQHITTLQTLISKINQFDEKEGQLLMSAVQALKLL